MALAGVGLLLVLGEVGGIREGFAADVAAVRLFPFMDPQVLPHIAAVAEFPAALGASVMAGTFFERLSLACFPRGGRPCRSFLSFLGFLGLALSRPLFLRAALRTFSAVLLALLFISQSVPDCLVSLA